MLSIQEYDPARPLEINDLRLTFRHTRHYIDTYSIRAEHGNASVVYSADTAPCDSVVEHAANCSLFLCEATLGLGHEEGMRGHSSAEEAGEMAERAGVHRLVLTHYGSTYAPDELEEAAQSAFSGRVSMADDGIELSVEGSSSDVSSPRFRPAPHAALAGGACGGLPVFAGARRLTLALWRAVARAGLVLGSIRQTLENPIHGVFYLPVFSKHFKGSTPSGLF